MVLKFFVFSLIGLSLNIHAQKAGDICLKIAGVNSSKMTQNMAIKCSHQINKSHQNDYFQDKALSMCSEMIRNSYESTFVRAINCLSTIRNKVYNRFSIQLCSKIMKSNTYTSTQDRVNECLEKSGKFFKGFLPDSYKVEYFRNTLERGLEMMEQSDSKNAQKLLKNLRDSLL